MKQKEWQAMVNLIDKAGSSIELVDPRNVSIHWFRGNANLQMNKIDEAKEDFEKALTQSPNAVMVLTDMGAIHIRQGNYADAITMFEQALKIYPTYKAARINLGLALYLSGKYQEALNNLYLCKTKNMDPKLENLINEIAAKMKSNGF